MKLKVLNQSNLTFSKHLFKTAETAVVDAGWSH